MESPKLILFYLFPTLQLFLFHFPSSSSVTTGLHFSFSILHHSALFSTMERQTSRKKGRQTDRQQGERYSQSKVTISDTHILEDLFLSQKHFNFIKERESKLICIRLHSIYSAHTFIALESPFLIPWLIKSQKGNATVGRGENSFADLASGA